VSVADIALHRGSHPRASQGAGLLTLPAVKRPFRVAAWIVFLVVVTSALWRVVLLRRSTRALEPFTRPWPPIAEAEPEPEAAPAGAARSVEPEPGQATARPPRPVEPEPEAATARPPRWVEPSDGACPASHPIKAKLGSRIFQPPGMSNYQRTRADRCYESDEAAIADGFTRAKH